MMEKLFRMEIIQPDMSLSEEPESILDRQERVMRNKVIPFVKILWKNHPEREATWETEESMRATFFCNVPNAIKAVILSSMPFAEGTLLVRYLGVPLISFRLLYHDCKVLVEKLEDIVNDWRNKFLSVAGRCLSDESLVIPLEELRVDDKLHFVEDPVEVMDREIKQLKRSLIPIIK
ncbi:reverse transcriptase domain, reverse transcriptase zinc-binding domain protein, partial [Tanacetum coccineum]